MVHSFLPPKKIFLTPTPQQITSTTTNNTNYTHYKRPSNNNLSKPISRQQTTHHSSIQLSNTGSSSNFHPNSSVDHNTLGLQQNSHQHLEYYNIATPTNNNSHRSVESVSVVSKKTKAKSNFQRVKKYLSKLGSRGNSRKNSTGF